MSNTAPFIDTNVFLRFLVYDRTTPELSKKAKVIFEQIQAKTLLVQTNICIVSELVYVLESYYEISKGVILEKIIPLISLDNVLIHNKEDVLQSLFVYRDKSVDFEDAYTYVLMKDTGVDTIYTFDKKHFKRFEDIKILC